MRGDGVAPAAAGNDQPPPKRRRKGTGHSTNSFLRSWAWKREHSVRFEQPYVYRLGVPGQVDEQVITIQQAPFDAQGFASTVWDSSIVLAKFLEKQAAAAAALAAPVTSADATTEATACENQQTQPAAAHRGPEISAAAAGANAAAKPASADVPAASYSPPTDQQRDFLILPGSRFLDLSAGCGLVGIAAARLGAKVTATDLGPNLPLLRANCAANGPSASGSAAIQVVKHEWGADAGPLRPPFDIIAACDVMYIDDAVAPLVKTLAAVSAPHTYIYVAHGRNRQAEATFMRAAEGVFEVSEVPVSQLDDIYHCSDVSVLLLSKRH